MDGGVVNFFLVPLSETRLFDKSLSFRSSTSRSSHHKRSERPSLRFSDSLLVISFLPAFIHFVQSFSTLFKDFNVFRKNRVVEISFLSILRFCRLKIEQPFTEIFLLCWENSCLIKNVLVKHKDCFYRVYQISIQQEFSQHNKCISVVGGSILSGKNAKCSES
eukprot:sb/3472685/